MTDRYRPTLAELDEAHREQLRKELLEEMLAGEDTRPHRLTVAEIKQMTPEQVLDRKDDVDATMSGWDGMEPAADEEPGEADDQDAAADPALSPVQQLRARLDAMPQAEAMRYVTEHDAEITAILGGEAA